MRCDARHHVYACVEVRRNAPSVLLCMHPSGETWCSKVNAIYPSSWDGVVTRFSRFVFMCLSRAFLENSAVHRSVWEHVHRDRNSVRLDRLVDFNPCILTRSS